MNAASLYRASAVVLGAGIIVACAASSKGVGSDAGGGAASCSELADSARNEVSSVLDAHRTCTQASDCKAVALSASCFDSCGRAIRTDGEAAVAAAKNKVDQAQCAQFVNQGCKLIIPPCVPPSPVTCTGGMCTN